MNMNDRSDWACITIRNILKYVIAPWNWFDSISFQSRTSLVSSSDGGVLAEGETSSSGTATDTSNNHSCDLGLYERLSLTHPVWFLPGIQRAGAVHLLQGKDEGVSIPP